MELTTTTTSGDNSCVKSLTPRALTYSTYYFTRRHIIWKIDNRDLNIKEILILKNSIKLDKEKSVNYIMKYIIQYIHE